MPLVCEGVGVRYEGVAAWALREASLSLCAGEVVGVAGRSGSGKTTLLKCLAGRLTPTEGAVRIEPDAVWDAAGQAAPAAFGGAPAAAPAAGEGPAASAERALVPGPDAAARRAFAERVCLVDQLPERQLFGQSVYEDVAFGPRNAGLEDEAVAARVDAALHAVGFDAERARQASPFALSGGEQRRVALAGMLALESPYLLLDEPTAGLDAAGRAALARMIAERAEAGVCVVVVSHDLDFLAEIASRLVVLDDGRIALDAPPAEAFTHCDALERAGLEVPLAARMARRLRARGVEVGAAATADALVSAVAQVVGAAPAGEVRP